MDNKSYKTDKTEMLDMLSVMLDETSDYSCRLEAYQYLSEDCEDILQDMLSHIYTVEGDAGKMLMEVLAEYKGRKSIYMGLVSYLYKGDDVALFAKLLGSYGDENAIMVLKTFADEYEFNYVEFVEVRNAIEALGGDFDLKEDFSDDPLYRYLKGLDEVDDESRKSPFEDLFNHDKNYGNDCDDDAEDYDCNCHNKACIGEGCEEEDCNCHDKHQDMYDQFDEDDFADNDCRFHGDC